MKTFIKDLERLRGYKPKAIEIMKLLITESAILCVFLYRLQDFFYLKKIISLAKVIRVMNHWFTGSDIALGVTIGEGLIIRHSSGIVIGSGTIIGKNCTLLHQTTFGEKYGDGSDLNHKYPILGDGVIISAGAKLIGDIHIGNHVVIGANAVVTKNVPDYCLAIGIPAQIRKIKNNNQVHATS